MNYAYFQNYIHLKVEFKNLCTYLFLFIIYLLIVFVFTQANLTS